MGEHHVARNGVVRPSLGEGEARARARQRLEAEMLQVTRGTDVPRVGDDEASALMELAECCALFGEAGHDGTLFLLLPAAGKSTRLSEGFGGVGWTGCRACASRKSWGAGPMALQGGLAMPSFADQAANRRKFLQYLAASPLFAAGGLEAFAGEGPVPGTKLPDPLMWAPMRTDELIKSPKDAINVFDFEPVARKNVPPAHFGYMASGIDDEVTLRANRDGFLKFQLRPRRLVDVSAIDMTVDIFGARYDSPIVIAPTSSNRAFHPDGAIAVAKAARAGNRLQMLSTVATTSIEEAIASRGAPVWFQLYPTRKWEIAEALVMRADRAGSPVIVLTVDGPSPANWETLARLRR